MTESANYGKVIRSYQGSGELHFEDGEQRACEFEVIQNTVGTIYAVCELPTAPDDIDIYNIISALQLIGIADEKKKITVKSLIRKDMHQEASTGGVLLQFVFIGRELEIESGQYPKSDDLEFRFALTNLVFQGTESYAVKENDAISMSRQLPIETDQFSFVIRHLQDCDAQVSEIRATKQPNVTCHAIIAEVSAEQEQDVIDAVNDLCLLLTLARGCRIEWPHYDVLSPSGKTVKSYHRDAIIKPYSGLALIAKNPPDDLKSFVESSYPILPERQKLWELRKAVDTYTDAKLETDFLESRGLKTVVVMEHLRSQYLARGDMTQKTIIDSRLFRKAKKQLRNDLKQMLKSTFPENEDSDLDQMLENAQGLNRVSFAVSISEMCNTLGLEVDDEHKRFVRIRNKLIHGLAFLDETDQDGGAPIDQYKFLTTFVGKILLAILGYDSYYYDWTNYPGTEGNTEMRVKLDLQTSSATNLDS